jgi:hypothetical protein
MITNPGMLIGLVLLGGCSGLEQNLGNAGANPGGVDCGGKGIISIVGNVSTFAGINGSVTFDCGTGAYFRQGVPGSPVGPIASPASAPKPLAGS